ncbi:hypothetical protein GCM10010974_33670 [Brevibacterium sediminis]|uniref:Uncharacterized protein n=1 Tax=Brevibacterium sediminis TaxID=1857024 RepID=A0ABQ1MX34_9MICO|nr:hypothetical protein GCM10010974_33670 [Brevibacterium sediminis]
MSQGITKAPLDRFRRITANDHVGFNILGDNGTRGDNGAGSYFHIWRQCDIGPDPNVVSYHRHGLWLMLEFTCKLMDCFSLMLLEQIIARTKKQRRGRDSL